MRVIPKGYHFKRILRKKTEKKAEWRVSTERQVQTGNPLRTQTRSVASDHVRTQGASAHSAGPGFFCLSVWVVVGMVVCCVAWSRGPMPNQVACCVVGLWGCGVCVCVFVLLAAWVPKSFKNLLRLPTSTKTEQKWDQNRPQMRPIWARGGEGAIENQQKYEKV